MRTNWVTLSLLELLIAAKNTINSGQYNLWGFGIFLGGADVGEISCNFPPALVAACDKHIIKVLGFSTVAQSCLLSTLMGARSALFMEEQYPFRSE